MNEVTNFMYYVYNRWSEEESKHIFGEDLGNHIFKKWQKQGYGKELLWYSELDRECKDKLVARANELYGDNRRQ